MIQHDYYVIESLYYAFHHKPGYEKMKLSKEEVKKAEHHRSLMSRTVMPLLGAVKMVASRFPPQIIREKLTSQWFRSKMSSFPELIEVLDREDKKAQRRDLGKDTTWLENEAEEIRLFVTGRLLWHSELRRMIIL